MRRIIIVLSTLVLLFGACFTGMAVTFTHTENFDEAYQIVGSPPIAAYWYNLTFGTPSFIMDDRAYSSPNSIGRMTGIGAHYTEFNVADPSVTHLQDTFVSFRVFIEVVGGSIFYIQNGSTNLVSIYGQDDGLGNFNVSYTNASGRVYNDTLFPLNAWYPCTVWLPFSSHPGEYWLYFNQTIPLPIGEVPFASSVSFENTGTMMTTFTTIGGFTVGHNYASFDDITWKHDRSPPFISSHSPANGSLLPSLASLSPFDVSVDDLERDDVNVTYHIMYYESVFGVEWLNISSYSTGVVATPHNFSFPLSTLTGTSYICPKTLFGWYVTVTDSDGTSTYPNNLDDDPATYYDISGQDHPVGTSDYVWLYNSSATASSVVINYPSTTSYTKSQWRSNHNLSVTVSNPDGLPMDVSLLISVPWTTTLLGDKYIVYKPWLTGVPNGTYTCELSDYIWYGNVNYTIKVGVYTALDWCGGGIISWSANDTEVFSIGSPALSKTNHVAIRSLTPADGDMTAYQYLNQGFTLQVRANTSFTFYEFLADSNRKMVVWSNTHIIGPSPDWYTAVGWQTEKNWKNSLQLHKKYYLYFGVDGANYATTQFDMLYDDNCVYVGKFAMNLTLTLPKQYFLTEVWGVWDPQQCTGVRAIFGTGTTVSEGESLTDSGTADTSAFGDQTGQGGGSQYIDPLSALGVGWMSVIAGLFVILGISLIPFFITKTFPPMMIQMLFTGFGSILSFSFGFFPLWLFIVACIILLLFLFYKVYSWAKASQVAHQFVDQGKASGITGLRIGKTVAPHLKKGLRDIGIGKKVRY